MADPEDFAQGVGLMAAEQLRRHGRERILALEQEIRDLVVMVQDLQTTVALQKETILDLKAELRVLEVQLGTANEAPRTPSDRT